MSTARPLREIGRDLRKLVETETRRAGLAILRESKREAPVGKPRLWQVNQGRRGKLIRPAGYQPGTFKRAFAFTWLRDRPLFVIGNPMPYALRLTQEGHSKQVPKPWWSVKWLDAILAKVASSRPPIATIVNGAGSGGAATFGGGER